MNTNIKGDSQICISVPLTMFAPCLTSSGVNWSSECVLKFAFVNIYISISDKSSLVLIDSDKDLIIISLMFDTQATSSPAHLGDEIDTQDLHCLIRLIDTQATTTTESSFLFPLVTNVFDSFAQKCLHSLPKPQLTIKRRCKKLRCSIFGSFRYVSSLFSCLFYIIFQGLVRGNV